MESPYRWSEWKECLVKNCQGNDVKRILKPLQVWSMMTTSRHIQTVTNGYPSNVIMNCEHWLLIICYFCFCAVVMISKAVHFLHLQTFLQPDEFSPHLHTPFLKIHWTPPSMTWRLSLLYKSVLSHGNVACHEKVKMTIVFCELSLC